MTEYIRYFAKEANGMTRKELVELVEAIRTVRDQQTNRVLSEEEHHVLAMKFKKNR